MKTKSTDKVIVRRILLFSFFVVLFVWVFIYYSFSRIKENNLTEELLIPPTFAESKESLSEISKKISNQNNELAQKIEAIKAAERSGNKKLALSLIKEAEEINKAMYQDSQNFVSRLKNLEDSLKDFQNPYLEELANNAIEVEKKLMNEFNSYTLLVEEFLSKLSLAISNPTEENKKNAEKITVQLNEKINKINALNAKFNENIKALSIK